VKALTQAQTTIATANTNAQAGLSAANTVASYITQAQTYENMIPGLLQQESKDIGTALGYLNTANGVSTVISNGCASG
jgi:hypothetical protein